MPVNESTKIDPAWTIHDVVQSRPETNAVLRSYGIDTCCGSARTLTEAATAASLDAATLVRALEAVSFDRAK